MSHRNTTDPRNALRRALGVADSGLGLAVVDQGNPRTRGGMASSVFAAPI
jgi:hypothetical protein